MKLTELDPRWLGAGGEGVFQKGPDGEYHPAPERHGVGITFICPCPTHQAQRIDGDEDHNWNLRVAIEFRNPLDGGEPFRTDGHSWEREGETFETLTLRPSIQRVGGCAWHGFITNGDVTNA